MRENKAFLLLGHWTLLPFVTIRRCAHKTCANQRLLIYFPLN
ncbi:unnamed protein product [Spirodela intermedia]|uniref:Uncharacterized protein n=1 Tax=Spirodela intermedia TaxID=51605 RepID=A0A7I8IZF4_SPIIN|nr:unnamed protein product [Spirodela intermedia]CAA6663267.1 unnamed protein product [Spirodela intermedia]